MIRKIKTRNTYGDSVNTFSWVPVIIDGAIHMQAYPMVDWYIERKKVNDIIAKQIATKLTKLGAVSVTVTKWAWLKKGGKRQVKRQVYRLPEDISEDIAGWSVFDDKKGLSDSPDEDEPTDKLTTW